MICKMRYTEFSRQVKVVNIIHYILIHKKTRGNLNVKLPLVFFYNMYLYKYVQ